MNKSIIEHLHQRFRLGQANASSHLADTERHINQVNPRVRAFVQLAFQQARSQAKKLDQGALEKPLHGVTVGIKDVIQTVDNPVTLETKLYYEQPIYPQEDALAVKHLRQAGTLIVGKTNTHEMGMGPTGDVGYSGHARNPHHLGKVTGGSSSGSAAAIASGLVDATLGSDTGGSIRLPSALSGLVGMKPSFGRVSNSGFLPLSYSNDTIGPMTQRIKDNALVLQAISAFDPQNMYAKNFSASDFTENIGAGLQDLKIGYPKKWLEGPLDSEIYDNYFQILQVCKNLGAELVTIEVPDRDRMQAYRASHQTVLISEAYHAHQEELKYPGKIAPDIYLRLLTGNKTSLEYVQAFQDKQSLIHLYQQIYNQCDVLLTPSVMTPACDLYERDLQVAGQSFSTMEAYTEFTWMDSFTGFPSMNLPSGFTKAGLPLGILINADYGEEALIYQVGAGLEKELDLDLNVDLTQGQD